MLALASSMVLLVASALQKLPRLGVKVSPFAHLKASRVVDPRTGASVSPLEGLDAKRSLVVLLPQLGDLDSFEFCEHLVAVRDDIERANVELRVIGVGDVGAAERFCNFTGLPLGQLRVDPEAAVHRSLGLHAGPEWEWPALVPDGALALLLKTLPGGPAVDAATATRPAANAWLRYLAMWAGISSPGTLAEIWRGYAGDASAPERLAPDAVVTAGHVVLGPGVGSVAVGSVAMTTVWADESGSQRPAELATVRLRHLVEILSHWDDYVSRVDLLAQRGATLLFNSDGDEEYSYRHRGLFGWSETMGRPLSFLVDVIGEARARNPLGFRDVAGDPAALHARGPLKAAGKAAVSLAPLHRIECRLQTWLAGVGAAAREGARERIDAAVGDHPLVLFTYAHSPFSSEAIQLVAAAGATCHVVEVGPQWFLLDAEASAMRLELLERTGQSSFPHAFVGGRHLGGLFSGPSADAPGLAALVESGELAALLTAQPAASAEQRAAVGGGGVARDTGP